MSEIKSVAVAGASGNLGPHVVQALIGANIKVTVLTRANKKPGAYDASVKVVEVDFKSVDSLTAALQGTDAVVSTVAGAATETQTILIDAAIAAGVKRFIPSEFGSCTTNPKIEALPPYAPMFKIKQYLREKASEGKLTWTVLACGAFLDLLLGGPFLLDFSNHSATLYDGGDNRISSTSFANVGKAIVGILQNFEETKNKIVWISEIILTQNELLRIARELRPEIKWDLGKVATSAMLKEGVAEFDAGEFSMPVFMKILKGTAFAGDTYGGAYDKTDNELLGINGLDQEGLRKLISEKLA